MKKVRPPNLPPIAVEETPEKLSLTVPAQLKSSLEQFSAFFADTTGWTCTSFNAVVVGILTGYLRDHSGYQTWLKSTACVGDPLNESTATS